MKREILINAAARETRIAILEDDRLVELLVDRPDNRRMIGDIYLGKVEAVLPGIQAAFVNIGTEKSAFLHASDVQADDDSDDDSDPDDHDDDESEPGNGNGNHSANGNGGNGGNGRRGKGPPIQDVLKRGQDILVQVTKEPISTKGPRVTAQISLAGRFLVYIPDGGTRVGVSRKIGQGAERQRLKEMVRGFLPEKVGGVIFRTVCEDVSPELL
jgi:ribonuclease G